MPRDIKPDERNKKNSRMRLIYVIFYVTILNLWKLYNCNKEKQLMISKSHNIISSLNVTTSLYFPQSLVFEIT
jgi:hypothetical protein